MANEKAREKLLRALGKPNTRYKFRELRQLTGLNDPELQSLMAQCRKDGIQIVYLKHDKKFQLSTIPTPYSNLFDLSQNVPTEGILGIVSDTHLCSNAERLDLLQAAYDRFVKEGITAVFHIGDVTDGWEVYRGHSQFVKVIGGMAQARYAIQHYPSRKFLTTYAIGGNHDLASYLKTGIDQLSLVVNGFDYEGSHYAPREDFVYLGQYSRYLIFPQEVRIHLIHIRGGMTYAKSYKQQKRAWAMDKESMPDVQFSGHLHQFCWIVEDGCQMIACPGLQDETEFFKRQGDYPRELGYLIVNYKIADGKIRRFKVEYLPAE